MREQNQDLSTQHREYELDIKKKQFDLEKEGKDQQRIRLELEAEMRNMESQFTKSTIEHY